MNEKLCGVVLCGGDSKRMGRDKGLLLRNGKYWAHRLFVMLQEIVQPVYYSIKKSQLAAYREKLDEIPVIPDSGNISGPLAGIISVHRELPGDDLFVVACDMQEMVPMLIKQLITVYATDLNHDFFSYQDKRGRAEPLCAIYRARGLTNFMKKCDGNPESFSLRDLIHGGNSLLLPFEAQYDKYFHNSNRPEEIDG